jgi:hypothetical protein
MKIIEGLKKTKDLKRKADDLKRKVAANAAIMENEKPLYADPKAQVTEWLQAHSDVIKELLALRIAIQRTNLEVMVPIEIGGKTVTKSIAEWVHRRRDLATEERNMWKMLTDCGLKPQTRTGEKGSDYSTINVQRNFDPAERDRKIGEYENEPYLIDAKLEIVNAITDLIGYDELAEMEAGA